jgi:hypothetical protein
VTWHYVRYLPLPATVGHGVTEPTVYADARVAPIAGQIRMNQN